MPENGLAGAAALVTGASRGIGRGIATRLVPRAHGGAYAYHHYRLVQPFLSAPARQSPPTDDLTSSGPPLETVIAGLQRL
jgi:NAD(P)-dependent dehydrogenase (short-subunit alcohol dehydrogenase family)